MCTICSKWCLIFGTWFLPKSSQLGIHQNFEIFSVFLSFLRFMLDNKDFRPKKIFGYHQVACTSNRRQNMVKNWWIWINWSFLCESLLSVYLKILYLSEITRFPRQSLFWNFFEICGSSHFWFLNMTISWHLQINQPFVSCP